MRAKVNPLSKVSMKQSGLDRLKENVTSIIIFYKST